MTADAATRRFVPALTLIAIGGFAIRLAYILVERRHVDFGGDAFYYHAAANLLADGKGFIDPFHPRANLPSAHHPPLYSLWLTIPSLVGLRSQLAHLVWSAVLGTGSVVVIGLVGREIGGRERGTQVGLIAAGIAAVAPNLVIPDASLMAETVTIFCTALALLAAYRYWKRPRWSTLAWLGAACGAGALSRSELILFVPLLVVPLALLAPGLARRERWVGIVAGGATALLVMAPWVGFNMTRFERPEYLSTQFGLAMSSTNCDAVWKSDFRSYFSQKCSIDLDETLPPGLDPSEQDAEHRKAGLRYVREHLGELPGILAARALAIAGLYHPTRQIAIDSRIEGRGDTAAHLGMYSFYLLAALSVVGGVAIRRARRVPVFPLLVPPVAVLATVLVIYASTRFRSSAEVSLCLLAAAGLDGAVRRLSARGTEPGPANRPNPGTTPATNS